MGRKEGKWRRGGGGRELKGRSAGMVCKIQRIVVVNKISSITGREDKNCRAVSCNATRCAVSLNSKMVNCGLQIRSLDSLSELIP